MSAQGFCTVGGGGNLGGQFCDESEILDWDGVFFVRVKLHVIRSSAGTGGQSPAQVEEAMGFLDRAYNKHGIFFVQDCDIDYIDNDDCMEVTHVGEPAFANCYAGVDDPDAINIYLFPDHLGTDQDGSGASSGVPSRAFALIGKINVNKDPALSIVRSFSMAHEIGHCLGFTIPITLRVNFLEDPHSAFQTENVSI